jgi:type I restriction-modification system DNA methylase subunit
MAEGMENVKLNYRNSKLFSHASLEEHLPKLPEWQIPEDKLKAAMEKLQSLFQQALPPTSEAALEEELIRPILGEVLGFSYLVQPSAAVFKTHRQPDYALYASEDEKQAAKAFDGQKRLFENALAVADAKAWDINLDAVGPASQMHDYTLISGVRWGILTNGRRWRLTHRDTVHELDTFFEVDVEELLKAADPASLKYFLVFFRAESFQPGGFLDHVLTQSIEYAQRVGAELKENVYEALRCLCQGFLEGNAEPSPEDLAAIHQNALIALYRILFLLYAESERERELLPLSNVDYRERIGLCALKRDVADQRGWLAETHSLWSRLSDLFRLVNQGSESLGIYAYNGGLFDPQLHPLLERWQIADRYLAEALKLLACTQAEGRRGFLDYSALDVRELGSIYEGLLEHRLVLRDGSLEWEKDRSERKKTGSYYTPEYIVQYIVEQTIGPLIDEIQSVLKTNLDELSEKIRHARGENRRLLEQQRDGLLKKARERVLDLKILDPAMGSGHFLVSACDYVARRIPELEAELTGEETEEAAQALKRTVAERSLYGVDLNPLATELAKLSLWLHTVAKGKPLSFLDHHLRTGNSLIGARVKDLERPPSGKAHEIGLWESKLVQDLSKAIGYLDFIKESASASRSDIEEKKQRWELVNAWIGKYKRSADVWLSSHFGNAVSDDAFYKILEAAASNHLDEVADSAALRQAREIASEKRFFHWELEFPDVFFDKYGRRLENPGFDAVIGNPPYGSSLDSQTKTWAKGQYESSGTTIDNFALFLERAIQLSRQSGLSGKIVPSGWLSAREHLPLRRALLSQVRPTAIVHMPKDVFPDAYIDTIVWVARKAAVVSTDMPLKVLVKRFAQSERVEAIPLSNVEYTLIDGSRWFSDPQMLIVTDVGVGQWLGEWTKSGPFLLGDKLLSISRGITPFVKGETAGAREVALGFFGSIGRYALHAEEWAEVVYDSSLSEYKPIRYFTGPRLIIRRIISRQGRIHATLAVNDFVINKSYLVAITATTNYDLFYVLAIVNSRLLSQAFVARSEIAKRDDFPQLDIATLREFPIRRIAFATPKDERARIVEEGKRLYFEALEKLGLKVEK